MRGKRIKFGKSLRVSCSSRRSRCQGRVTYAGNLGVGKESFQSITKFDTCKKREGVKDRRYSDHTSFLKKLSTSWYQNRKMRLIRLTTTHITEINLRVITCTYLPCKIHFKLSSAVNIAGLDGMTQNIIIPEGSETLVILLRSWWSLDTRSTGWPGDRYNQNVHRTMSIFPGKRTPSLGILISDWEKCKLQGEKA